MLVKGSFEEIIYVVIGVLWIAYSIYKGTQKGKAKSKRNQTPTDAEEKKKSVFDTFLDDILAKEEPVLYTPPAEDIVTAEKEVESEVVKEKVFSYDDYYEESNYQERFSVTESKLESDIKIEVEPTILPSKKRKKPRIDLRKAVIYSEILNRRYF